MRLTAVAALDVLGGDGAKPEIQFPRAAGKVDQISRREEGSGAGPCAADLRYALLWL